MDDEGEFPLNPKAVEFGRQLGRIAAEHEAIKLISRLVVAAGGRIEVADRLLVGDDSEILVSDDPINGSRIYRVRDAADRMGRAIG